MKAPLPLDESKIAGYGRKRQQVDVPVDNLLLDPQNPRLPSESKGKSQQELLAILKRDFDLDEIAFSIAANGYFDEEPVVAIPVNLPSKYVKMDYEKLLLDDGYNKFINNPKTTFHVVEGNRRLSTVKLLLSSKLQESLKIRTWPELTKKVVDDIRILPVIVYPTRKEVLPYLGVRHITGILKWEPYAKAVYIAEMMKSGYTIDSVQKQVGDRSNSARRVYLTYQLIQVAESSLDIDVSPAKDRFSYLTLAIGQATVKGYLGLPVQLQKIDVDEPLVLEHLDRLKNLFSWLFGEDELDPVIRESRDITNFLTYVLASPEATQYLLETRNLREAFERANGEEHLVIQNLQKARRALSSSVGYISSNKTEQVRRLVEDCAQAITDMRKLLK
jgi:hypothetical protein